MRLRSVCFCWNLYYCLVILPCSTLEINLSLGGERALPSFTRFVEQIFIYFHISTHFVEQIFIYFFHILTYFFRLIRHAIVLNVFRWFWNLGCDNWLRSFDWWNFIMETIFWDVLYLGIQLKRHMADNKQTKWYKVFISQKSESSSVKTGMRSAVCVLQWSGVNANLGWYTGCCLLRLWAKQGFGSARTQHWYANFLAKILPKWFAQ